MATLTIPNSFSPNTTILSSQVNADFSAVATWANTYAVQTDVSKTITVSHTWNADQTFGGRIVLTSAVSKIVPGGTSISHRNNADNADNLLISDGGTVTARNSVTILSGQLVLTSGMSSSVVVINSPLNTFGGRYTWQNNAVDKWYVGHRSDDSDNFEILSAAGKRTFVNPATGNWSFPAQNTVANGIVITAGGLTVSAGGASVTGNLVVTGNISATGTVTAVQGSNAYVRATTTVNFTSGTDLTLAFAVGASQEWEFEYVLTHTNSSASTASFTIVGPASSTGFFGAVATVFGAGSATQGAVQLAIGNSLTGLTMNATAGYTVIRGYIKTAGTPGNVAVSGTASAGTGVLQAGSYVRYARIA